MGVAVPVGLDGDLGDKAAVVGRVSRRHRRGRRVRDALRTRTAVDVINLEKTAKFNFNKEYF